jgi:hypothetical protein
MRLISATLALACVVTGAAAGERHEIAWPGPIEVVETVATSSAELRIVDGVIVDGARWPARVVRIELPPDSRLSAVSIEADRERVLDGPPGRYRGPEPNVTVDRPARTSQGFDYWILPEGDFRGHRIGHVLLCPFRIVDGELRHLESFALTVELEPGRPAPDARRIRHPRTEAADARALRALLDADPLPPPAGVTAPLADVPPELGPETIEYAIITTEAMAPAFEAMALLKTREGQPAKITTVEWILGNYEGIDLAARVRTYLRDLYLYQGLRYAMLAGDADEVPARFAISRFQTLRAAIPADLYFACLDGDWNADGDSDLGEAPDLDTGFEGDGVDLYAELAVARVPCGSLEEAEIFVQKWKSYTGYDPASFRTDYQNKLLAFAEVLLPPSWEPGDPPAHIQLDGAAIAESSLTFVTDDVITKKLYQYYENPDVPDALPELRDSVIAEINRGHGWLLHVGHGYRTNMSVGDGKLENQDVDAFTNTDAYSMLYAINCTSGAFPYDCIVEHMLLNPVGGIVGSIASTDLDYPNFSDDFEVEFFRLVFQEDQTTLGDAFHTANFPFVALAGVEDNATRWTILSLISMGDPSMELWRGAPGTLDLAFPATMNLGAGSFSVTVTDGGNPVDGAVVCLWKSDGYGVAGTNAAGVAVVDFLPETTGTFIITATKNSYVAAVDSATVTGAATAALRVEDWTLHEGTAGGGSGNGDHRADAGESVVFDVTLRNYGSQIATGVAVTLHANSPFVITTDSTQATANIAPGATRSLPGAFAFAVRPDLPDTLRHVVAPAVLELHTNQGTWFEPLPFSLYQRLLDLTALSWSIAGDDGDGVLEAGETAELVVTVSNFGDGFAADVVGVGSVSGAFVLVDDTIDFGDLASGGDSAAGPMDVLSTGGGAADLAIELTISDAHSAGLLVRTLDIVAPAPPDSLSSSSSENAITLSWPRPVSPDIRGYRVFRSNAIIGPYEPLTQNLVTGGAFFVDEGLPPLTTFHYRASSVDSSGNESALSSPLQASTSPPLLEGWPVELPSGDNKGSPTFYDLDEDGANEVIFGWQNPMVVRAHADEFVDGDDDARTLGIFAVLENDLSRFWNSPAVADLDGDSLLEIVFCAWQVSTYGHLYVLDETGAVEPGWPREIGAQPWSTAAVGDVDGDSDLEIFVSSGSGSEPYRGVLFGFHHDGTEIVDGDSNPATTGVFYKSASTDARFMYTSPALADLDGDRDDEIIFLEKTVHPTPSRSTLYVFDGDGSVYPEWPYADPDLWASTSSPAAADLDGDGDLEIVAAFENQIVVLHDDATPLAGWPKSLPTIPDLASLRDFLGSPAVGDVDGDGQLDIALGWQEGVVYLWTAEGGADHAGFPLDVTDTGTEFDQLLRSPILGNIDGDPEPEIIVSSGAGTLYAIKADATHSPGFPLQLDAVVFGSAATWDLDGDGNVNLIVQTNGPLMRVYDFPDVAFRMREHPWPMFRHDARKTGCARTPVTIGVGGGPPGGATGSAAALPAHPNPASASRMTLPFVVPGGGARVRIRVFDVAGREVRELAHGRFPAGRFEISWDGRTAAGTAIAPGVYLARVEIADRTFVQKLTFVR